MERADLIRFLGTLDCVERHGGFAFLRDPHWSASEAAMAAEQMRLAEKTGAPEIGWLCIRTGGSGGGVKFARHDEATLGAAVRGCCAHFGLSRIGTVGLLPPWHVSGLMARLRSAATGGTYVDATWKAIAAGEFPPVPAEGENVLSLVPTQLQRLLVSEAARRWLRGFRIVFLGGGPTWPELADAAARAGVRVSLSYGMTETAAMAAAQHPDEFARGDRSCGRPLPHAEVRIDSDGRVVIGGPSLFRGYFPGVRESAEYTTQDLGEIDREGRLHVHGRVDGAILTGGMKVNASDVEAALRASGEFEDVVVVGVPDRDWGEIVVACYPAAPREPDTSRAAARLAPHQRPKRFVAVDDWPRSAQGKINRAALVEALLSNRLDRPQGRDLRSPRVE